MSELWIIIILGLVQGASEFLPISSSGHLVLFYNILGVKENTMLLSVVLHVATLVAVLLCYRKELWVMLKHPFCKTNLKLVVATIPTIVLALALNNLVEITFGNNFIIIGFLITAILLLISQVIDNRNKKICSVYHDNINKNIVNGRDMTNLNVSYKQAILIGIAQGLAVFPGISRSGSTIATSLILGVKKDDAADFSFLLSIPVILGGLLKEIINCSRGNVVLNFQPFNIAVGCICTFLSGLFCIKLMLKMVKRQNLSWFSFYLVILSIVLVVNQYAHFLY